jgi:DNA-binding response OmpR family regulator
MSKMLLGETQEELGAAIRDFFSIEHYTVERQSNGFRLLECLRQNHYAVIVLEAELPGLDAISVVRSYREGGGGSPILIIAETHCSAQLQAALNAGADAYLVKPIEMADLAAHVRALIRRPALGNHKILTSGAIAMDTTGGTVTRNDISVHLHPMEYKLLQFLMSHPNQVFSSHALFERVWKKDFSLLEDTVRTHVRTLRQKIDTVGSASIITTVRGLGYKSDKS